MKNELQFSVPNWMIVMETKIFYPYYLDSQTQNSK